MTYINPHSVGCFWHDVAERFGAPNVKWCEATRCSLISEPANTLSNIGYFAVAAILFVLANRASNPRSVRSLAAAVGFMGAMSFLYHLSNNFASQVLDFVGMFVMFAVVIDVNLASLQLFSTRTRRVIFHSLWLVSSLLLQPMYQAGIAIQVLVGFWAVIAGSLEIYRLLTTPMRGGAPLPLALGLFLVAGAFSWMDHSRVYCVPENAFVHGHALWHLVSAVAFASLAWHWGRQIDVSRVTNS